MLLIDSLVDPHLASSPPSPFGPALLGLFLSQPLENRNVADSRGTDYSLLFYVSNCLLHAGAKDRTCTHSCIVSPSCPRRIKLYPMCIHSLSILQGITPETTMFKPYHNSLSIIKSRRDQHHTQSCWGTMTQPSHSLLPNPVLVISYNKPA